MNEVASEPAFASAVFMVRPGVFAANAETAESNAFQARADEVAPSHALLSSAQREWDDLRSALVTAGVEVVWVRDEPEEVAPRDGRAFQPDDRGADGRGLDDRSPDGRSPDACFPNNWFTTHADGRLVLYPMESPTRRREVRLDFVDRIVEAVGARQVIDMRVHERTGRFLEGTGSLIPDRERRVVFAALSSRTDRDLLEEWCQRFGYRAVAFRTHLLGAPIYHTNVCLALGPSVALAGLDAVPDADERATLTAELEAGGREIVPLDEGDLVAFCGNVLFLRDRTGGGVWAMSARAAERFGPQRLARLEKDGRVIARDVSTIERVGGGGVRCMLAELFPRT